MAPRIHVGDCGRFSLSKCFLVIVFVSLASALFAQPSVSFVASRDYPVSGTSVAIGDFNQDGLPDIALGGSNIISILLQNRDGTFQSPVSVAAGNSTLALQVADFNHDGKPDLLSVDWRGLNVSVLLGNGDGTFQSPKLSNMPGGGNQSIPQTIAVGDFNQDGDSDLAFAAPQPQVGAFAITLLLGNGDGTFHVAAQQYRVSGTPDVIAAGDFNGDGKLDLISFTNSLPTEVFLGNGDGTFQAGFTGIAAFEGALISVLQEDLNHDGKTDLVVNFPPAGYRPSVLVFLGNGDGTFQSSILVTEVGFALAAGDVNGDGKGDLVTFDGSNLQILIGNGDGTFALGQTIAAGVGGAYGYLGQAIGALSDMNRDGKLDLVAVLGPVGVILGNGDGTFEAPSLYLINPQNQPASVYSLATADFNGDGKPDLAAAGMFPSGSTPQVGVDVLLGNGAGFETPIFAEVQACCISGAEAAGDFDNDGKQDLVVARNYQGNNAVAVLRGNGDGTFQPETFYGSGMTGPLGVGDFNNDGKLDVIGTVQGQNGAPSYISVLLGNGDGTFGFAVNSPSKTLSAMAVGDFNGDGKLDVAALVGDTPAQLQIFLGKGDGTFTEGLTYSAGAGPLSIAAGDMNGDGLLDLIVTAPPHLITVLLGAGDGTFSGPIITNYGGTGSLRSLAIADFNLDGKPDVAVVNDTDVSVLLGNGDGTLRLGGNFGMAGYGTLVVADFNGDGSPDIGVASYSSVGVLYNRASGPAAGLSPSFVAFGNQAIAHTQTQAVKLTNSGSAALALANIQLSASQSCGFSETNTCGASLTPGTNCTINVMFTPQSVGICQGSIQLTDNAFNSPQSIGLSGTGATQAAGASFTPGSLTFGNQGVGSSSNPQMITLLSSGNIPLAISSVTLTGVQAGDFSQSNNCGSTVANGSSCNIAVTFTPGATGDRAAALSIVDNASGSQQMVPLSGAGVTLGLNAGSGTATVAAGQLATYSIAIGGSGMSGTASLACTGAPQGATCSVPATVSVSGTTASNFQVSVTTTPRTMAVLNSPGVSRFLGTLAMLVVGLLLVPAGSNQIRGRGKVRVLLVCLTLLLICSCGGSSGHPSGTPAGTYQLTVAATANSATEKATLKLIVQ